MAMQAVIMAGGAGMRLRPMTCDCPKPLVPLCGAPVMDYALRLLARHGYDHATATLCYRPQDIKSAFGEGRHGVTLRYSEEKTPLGTAGSVLHALEGDGIYVGTGSACSSKKGKHSAVLTAMKTPNAVMDGAIRISLCPENTEEEMRFTAEKIKEHVELLRRFARR